MKLILALLIFFGAFAHADLSFLPMPRTAYTPVVKNHGGTDCDNDTATGYYWRAHNGDLCLEVFVSWAGACGATAGAIHISIPAGFSINSAVLLGGTTNTSAGGSLLGNGWWFDNGVGSKIIRAHYQSATSFRMSNDSGLLSDSNVANGDTLKFQNLCIPVTES